MDYRFEAGSPLKAMPCDHSPLRDYTNKVEVAICPKCRQDRPLDWFGSHRFCWKCRELHPELRERA